ncbi:MAG: phospholipase D-like domain-containing protein, partial [Oscillospiraceae bacterium]
DSETEAMIKLAAKSGVDVRIITPNIPDKWYVDAVTKSNYNSLIKAGVRIYEYKPGFIHAKSIISDDKAAILGTANFDFRSFYFLFENSVLLYNSPVINDIKSDFMKCIEDSIEITEEMILKRNFLKKIYYSFMKFFAPFM